MLRPAGTPNPIKPSTSQHMVETINEALVKTLPVAAHSRPGLRLHWATKRVLDATIAVTALGLLLPLLAVIALLVWGHDGRSPIFRHMRLGRYGRPFACLKFRSMVSNGDAVLAQHLAADPQARAEWEATFKLTRDPRVTTLGQVLRKTSLDELPQLWNVLRGEMSLVGPRPIVQAEVARYGADFETCFSVPPGLTGLWQVSGRSDTGYAERIALDRAYAARWSLARDISILIKTVPAVLSQRGSR